MDTRRHLHRREGERHLCGCTWREADRGVCPAVVRTCWCSVSVRPLAQPGNLSPHSRSAIRDTGEARIPSPAPRGAPLPNRLLVRRLELEVSPSHPPRLPAVGHWKPLSVEATPLTPAPRNFDSFTSLWLERHANTSTLEGRSSWKFPVGSGSVRMILVILSWGKHTFRGAGQRCDAAGEAVRLSVRASLSVWAMQWRASKVKQRSLAFSRELDETCDLFC